MIYNNPNNRNNLHKLNHDQQPNCSSDFLGYREDREQLLFLATDSRFRNSTATLQQFEWLLITLIEKKHINWQMHTDERSPSCEATYLDYFWATRRSEVYDSGPHIVDLNFLRRCSMPGHKNWSTTMKIAQRNLKYIPRTDDPTVKPDWLFQNKKLKWVVRFWSPGYTSHHCAAN